jgi:hypothetical protein
MGCAPDVVWTHQFMFNCVMVADSIDIAVYELVRGRADRAPV